MRIVLDTNVLVSGLLTPYRAPAEIVRMASAGMLELCHDARVLSEYREVLLRPKFHFNENQIEALLDQIKVVGHPVVGEPLAKRLPDPTDEAFLEIALAGKAEYLVTGNLKDYPADKRQGVKVVSPNDFLDFYRKSVS